MQNTGTTMWFDTSKRMTKNYLIFICLLTLACSHVPEHEPRSKNKSASLRDSVLRLHLSDIQSAPSYDTSSLDFQILRADFRNDTIFQKNFLADHEFVTNYIKGEEYKKDNVYPDSCIRQPTLNQTLYEEVYRFIYSYSFCRQKLNITVGRSDDKFSLDFILYRPARYDDTIGCKIVSQFEINLTSLQWDQLKRAIDYSDFWSMQPYKYSLGYDGSRISVEGYLNRKSKVSNPPKFHIISRWVGPKTAILDAFGLVVKLSGYNDDCFEIKQTLDRQ